MGEHYSERAGGGARDGLAVLPTGLAGSRAVRNVEAVNQAVAGRAPVKKSWPADVAFLADRGFPERWLDEAVDIAHEKNLSASDVLIGRGLIEWSTYERHLADFAGAVYQERGPDPAHLVPAGVDDSDELRTPAAMARDGDAYRLFVSPEASGYERVASLASREPDTFRRAVFTGSLALRKALFERSAPRIVKRAVTRLATEAPEFSAFHRFAPGQITILLAALAVMAAAIAVDTRLLLEVAAFGFSAFYLAIVGLRTMLILRLDQTVRKPRQRYRPLPADPEDFPVYSIMVALYREAGQVKDLIAALDRLDWPASRREVFLLCEEDDPETVDAILSAGLPQGFEIVICPPVPPRTKPKALEFALPLCSGEFTVIYDAEDRPDPLQLREAWDRMRSCGEELACLQAPLLVRNGRQNWLTRMFAIEYLTLFCGTLPILESYRAVMPLGGTSNHFRTATLRAVGGWDPYNVTEDADLGIRLARLGFECGTISRPTWEEAPPVTSVWLKQRTRWLKGWVQTVLVHTRHPILAARQLGFRSTLFFHLKITSIVISMLVHPIFLFHVGWVIATCAFAGEPISDPLFFGLSIFNLAAGYTTYGCLAYGVMRLTGSTLSPYWLCSLPVYWLLVSAAGWRALYQFAVDPFRWEKTPHGLANSCENANIRSGVA